MSESGLDFVPWTSRVEVLNFNMKIGLTMLLQTTNFGNPIPIGLVLENGVIMTISFH